MPRRIFSFSFLTKILALSVYYKAKDSMVCGKYYSDKFILSESPMPKDARHRPSTPPRCLVPPELDRPMI